MPLKLTLNSSASSKFFFGLGTTSLSQKKTKKTARLRYTEQSTPKRDEKRRALMERGIDIGKSITNEKIVAQKT